MFEFSAARLFLGENEVIYYPEYEGINEDDDKVT